MQEIATRMMELFHGLDRAYGTYKISDKRDDKKLIGKATTKIGEVNTELWIEHLEGKQGIGIVPIMDDSTCFFGAIDIDSYHINHGQIIRKLKDMELPLVPARSKSGGMHLFLFTSEPVEAGLMQSKLRSIAAAVGFGTSEIFPKQTEILAERGDIGGWINMPYFNGLHGLRYGVREGGEAMKIEEFLDFAFSKRLTEQDLLDYEVKLKDDLEQGPPCLQHLITQGFPAGTRNDGLFNLGVYLRKAFPDDWKPKLEEFNHRFMFPPLGSTEVQAITKSLSRKEYFYSCDRPPIAPHCNSKLCRTRKFGVGSGQTTFPILNSLTKYDSEPPIWFVDVDGGGRIELVTEDLQSPYRFQRRCMDALNLMPPLLPKNQWGQIVQMLMENANIIEAPADACPVNNLMELLEVFCVGRMQTDRKEDILIGRVWTDDKHHYFRLSDFMRFLDRNNFRDFGRNKITSILRDKGGRPGFLNFQGRGCNIWKFPEFVYSDVELEPPEDEDPEVF